MERIGYTEVPQALFGAMMKAEEYLKSSEIDYKTLELMRLLVSKINGCGYCVDMHYKEAIAAGEDNQRLYSITCWQETPYYSEQERAIFAWAEKLTKLENTSELDQDFEALTKFFSKEEIAKLTLAITAVNSWNRQMIAFGFTAGNYQVPQ